MLPCPELLGRRKTLIAWAACPGCGQSARRIPAHGLPQQHLSGSNVTPAADRRCATAALTAPQTQPGGASASGRRPPPPSVLNATTVSPVAVAAPAEGEQALRSRAPQAISTGQKRWKGRADDGSAVSMFDAALEYRALRQCLYQAQRMITDFDEQQHRAQRPKQLYLTSPARGALDSNSSPACSAAARQHLFDTLRGRHQRFLRTCLAVGHLSLALDYMQILPRNEQLFTAFLKEAVTYCNLDQMHEILQVQARHAPNTIPGHNPKVFVATEPTC